MMTLQNFRISFNRELSKIYPKTEINALFFKLIKHQLNLSIADVFTKQDLQILPKDLTQMKNALFRLKLEEPIQYILKKTYFYGLSFSVTKHTLIPRPETEDLVNWVINSTRDKKKQTILDIGTGTGCIPIALKKHIKNAEISAIDISEKALKIAKKNALQNTAKINFIETDILSLKKLPQKYDVIVSNPPYVRELEKKELKKNVLEYEPHLALFVPDDNPLVFYDKISSLAKNYLNENGVLFFEINQYLATNTQNLLKQKGFKNIKLKKDLFGNARMLKAFL